MQAAQLAKSYRTAAISTASPGSIILMMMDSALGAIALALDGFREEHPVRRNEQIHNNLAKAQQIVAVLQAALDLEVEGDFPRQMYSLYGFMLDHLSQANARKVEDPITVVHGMLKDIREAWAEMLQQQMVAEA